MKGLKLLLLTSCAFAQNWQPNVTNARFETRTFSGSLDSQFRVTGPSWFGYAVKAIPGDHENCCWDDSNRGCWLEGRSKGASSVQGSTGPVYLEGPEAVAILYRVQNNAVEKIHVYSLSCALDAGGLPFIWLNGVPSSVSVSYLATIAEKNDSTHLVDNAVFAIAQHDGAEADAALDRFVRPTEPERLREKTTFWLGASRGAHGVALLKGIVASDPSANVRDKAVFGLSVSKQPEALDTLIQTARTDASPHVRGQAIFWLAQKAGKRASSTITDAIENDPDTQVKKRAVFALSQLPKDEGVPKLIEVARSQKNPEVRKQAFFWLGQSQDPRALAFIQEVLTK